MAFNFLGTIPSFEDFEEFEEFIQKEVDNLDGRIAHLVVERTRHDELVDRYLAADSKLRSAYTKSKRPDRLWLDKPRPTPLPTRYQPDASNAVDVEILKKNFLSPIKQKRERNEFKVKRLRDLDYQIVEEISELTEIKESYKDYLDKIRSRFDLDDFKSNQRNKQQDSAELIPGITKLPVDQGIEVEGSVEYYLVLSINAEFRTISFDGQTPPLKEGDKIMLTNGKNNGEKTVISLKDSRTVRVAEELTTENNSKTKVARVE